MRNRLTKEQGPDSILESINRNINEGLYRSLEGSGLIYVNQEFVKMFGYDESDDLLKVETISLFNDPAEFNLLGEDLLKNTSVTNRQIQFRRKDGSLFWGYLNCRRVKCKNDVVYYDGAIRDISEQKEAEKQVDYQRRMQKALIAISSRYMILAPDEVDEAFYTSLKELGILFEVDRVYFFEYNWDESTCSNTHEWCRDGITPVIDESQNVPLTEEFKTLLSCHFEGKPLFIPEVESMPAGFPKEVFQQQEIQSLLSVPMMDGDTCVGFVGFDNVTSHRNYTENEFTMLKLFANMSTNVLRRIKNHKELTNLLRSSTEQNNRLKDFSYITSHNFRAPVANMTGIIQLLKMDIGDSEYVELLSRSTSKLNETLQNINRLLNFENDLSMLKKEPCNLSRIVSKVVETNLRVIKERTIDLSVDVPDRLTVQAFPSYLENVVHNLLTNAIKYGTTENSNRIEIRASKTKDQIALIVQDYGLGICLSRHGDKLFQVGTRFHSGVDEGQGIGLFITKYQIEAMEASISVESKENQGSTFTISFPLD